MYLKSFEKSTYYRFHRADTLTENEEKAFLKTYCNYPDNYFGIVYDFLDVSSLQPISVNMIRKVFCIDYHKAESVFADLFWHSLLHIRSALSSNKEQWYSRHDLFVRDFNIDFSLSLGKKGFIKGPAEDYMNRFPNSVFMNTVAFDEITIDNNNLVVDAERLARETYGVKTNYLTSHTKALTELGNCLVLECGYGAASKFIKRILCNCDPRDIDLIFHGIKSEFPHVFHIFDFDWLKTELIIRKKIKAGESIYLDTFNKDMIGLLTHKTPIVVIVDEIAKLLEQKGAKKELKELLANCQKYGITFLFFSEYGAMDIPLQGIKRMLTITDEQQIMNIFDKTALPQSNKSIADINNMTGVEFEEFCKFILKNNGFGNVRMTETTGDYGGDLLAEMNGIKYVFQCKRYSNLVGISAVQEVIGSKTIYHTHVAVVFTNSYFTKNAEILAEKSNVLLWDRDRLLKMYELCKP